jgi:hypothetical protein
MHCTRRGKTSPTIVTVTYGPSFALDGVHGESRALFAHGHFTKKKLRKHAEGSSNPSDVNATAAAAAATAVAASATAAATTAAAAAACAVAKTADSVAGAAAAAAGATSDEIVR